MRFRWDDDTDNRETGVLNLMNRLVFPLLLASATGFFIFPAASASEQPSAGTRTFSWNELKRADGNVQFLEDEAWFCQAKTARGVTECHLGSRPPKPGCYVILNKSRTAWLAVDDAAAQLKAKFVADGEGAEGLSRKSGYGCGRPRPGDWWLLFQIP